LVPCRNGLLKQVPQTVLGVFGHLHVSIMRLANGSIGSTPEKPLISNLNHAATMMKTATTIPYAIASWPVTLIRFCF
jgi:hypothetical protein